MTGHVRYGSGLWNVVSTNAIGQVRYGTYRYD